MVDFTGGTWRSLIDGSEVGDIPDSALAQYRISEGQNGTISDDLDNEADGIADSDNYQWVSNNDYEGGFALTGDAEANFEFNSNDPFSFQDWNSNFTVAFTYRHSPSELPIYTTAAEQDNFDDVLLLANRDDVDDGYVWELRVGGEEITQAVDISFTEGELYRIVNEVDVDDIQVDVTINKELQAETSGTRPSFDAENKLWVSSPDIDHLIFYDGSMTEGEIDQDFIAQPWT